MKVLSLFSGVGGFDMGLEAAGMTTVGLCEIDANCRKVLRRHWPGVPIYEDVSTVTATQLIADGVVPDVVAFGSPCQDLSVAGKRAGLAGSRSGLFGEAMRIIRELRKETNGSAPTWAIWENVPGAFNSTSGRDFAAVLDAMADAGAMVLEWACLDAQNYGVPQRRRRIFLVACFDPATSARCPDPLLPVGEGSPRDIEASRKARKGAPTQVAGGAGSGGYGNSGFNKWRQLDSAVTLASRDHKSPNTVVVEPTLMRQREGKPGGGKGPLLSEGSSLTLSGSNDQYLFQPVEEPTLAFPSTFSNSNVSEDVSPSLTIGTGLEIASPPAVQHQLAVRRLTPLECERLMGWPDDHTRWADDGTEIKDTNRYKMCGNGVASPVAQWVGKHILRASEGTT